MQSTLFPLKVITILLILGEILWLLVGAMQGIGLDLFGLLGNGAYAILASALRLAQIGFYVLLLKLLSDLCRRNDDSGA